MSILILIILIVLFFLFVFWGLIKATPNDEELLINGFICFLVRLQVNQQKY